jgi:formylglycine-generating enzyme required for sulfatase activity
MEMVYVPQGEFTMGSPDGTGESDEHPQHKVRLDGYWIDKYEVSNQQFAKFVEDTGHKTEAEDRGEGKVRTREEGWHWLTGADWQHPEGPDSTISKRMNHPVVQASWSDAQAYCEWAGGQLPSEAQWEKAARGTDGRTYPWGDDFVCRNANTDDETVLDDKVVPGGPNCDGFDGAAPVGSFADGASPYGAMDMSGNVWEWVADWYGEDYYASSPDSNPTGPDSGETRVLRGGTWSRDENVARATRRFTKASPGNISTNYGFRCVSLQ